MKKKYLLILLVTLLHPGNSWGSDCVGFENMAVKILKQEGSKVYLSWKASVINKCNKMISARVEMQLVDSEDRSIGNGYHQVKQLLPKETREIKKEKSLPSEIYFKTNGYYFKASEFSDYLE